ncbi:MAG TPA: Gldg family protein [Planctomycetota bacterium]
MSAPRWQRLALGLRSALAAVLAAGAAWLIVDLADWRYARLDLSRSGKNTLDPALLDVIDKLPQPVVVDVFLRPLKMPYQAVSVAAGERVLEYLAVLQQARRSQVEIRLHDASDFEAIQERQRELGTEGTNKLVLSCGERRDELELFGELCTVDWGNPSRDGVQYLTREGIPGVVDPRRWQPERGFRPATLLEFRGEELLAQALLKVSSGEAPKVYFARGHGEPSLEGADGTDLARLSAALQRDGFTVGEWDALEQSAVPADCAVLALIGPQQPYQAGTHAAIRAYAEGGGRLVVAPDLSELDEERVGGVLDLLRGFGIDTRPGIVCLPLVGPSGEPLEQSEQCAWLVIDERGLQAGHPLTEPLRLRGRRVQFTFTPAFEGLPGEWGPIVPIVTTGVDAWRDLPPRNDFTFNPARGEERGRQTLVTARALRTVKDDGGAVRQGRLLAVASAYFFSNQLVDVNRDFALNAFNWLAEREYRLAVRPLAKSETFLDFERSSARPILTYLLWLVLPGVCAGIGLVVFLRRRS